MATNFIAILQIATFVEILSRNPDLFTAAFIASGMPKGIKPQTLIHTPIKVTVGTEE